MLKYAPTCPPFANHLLRFNSIGDQMYIEYSELAALHVLATSQLVSTLDSALFSSNTQTPSWNSSLMYKGSVRMLRGCSCIQPASTGERCAAYRHIYSIDHHIDVSNYVGSARFRSPDTT